MNNGQLAQYISDKINSNKTKEIKKTLRITRPNENEFLTEFDLINLVASFSNSKGANL